MSEITPHDKDQDRVPQSVGENAVELHYPEHEYMFSGILVFSSFGYTSYDDQGREIYIHLHASPCFMCLNNSM